MWDLQLNREIMDHEVSRQLEEPIAQEVDAEVKKLKQAIHNLNKQQVSLKTVAKGLKGKTDDIVEKVYSSIIEVLAFFCEWNDSPYGYML